MDSGLGYTAKENNETNKAMEDRETKIFWASHEGRVQNVQGWKCNNTDGYWWCPALGVSAHEGTSLFQTKKQAVLSCKAELGRQMLELQTKLNRLA